ncbi:MAG: 23S rRNA (pseudouridine(1915)-N(3))-methyltransferase RlmH, partial [Oscillospiraceae bacterium]|nr:23S rRNA (pseudouridine(1915)-N(3))-methyltransferase RlmH [Oscillospiraceae bacterium]
MQRITVICVGKLKEKFYIDAVAEYAKRLSRYCRLELIELPEQRLPENPSPAEIERALAKEAELIRGKLPPGAAMVAMCVEGRLRSSGELAQLMETWANRGEKCLAFVIGGSFGLDETLKGEAWARLSMSPMTFPHHLARVMLLEQLYSSFQISEGGQDQK